MRWLTSEAVISTLLKRNLWFTNQTIKSKIYNVKLLLKKSLVLEKDQIPFIIMKEKFQEN